MLCASCQVIFGKDFKIGYNLYSNEAGFSNLISGSIVEKYFEGGIKIGYGAASLFYEEKSDKRITTSRFNSNVLMLNIPLKLKYALWPKFIQKAF
jgi:hypothetical protein